MMIAAEQYLKTQSAADALGVSVSTIKRWVDSGMLGAVRTVGKHRLIPMSDARRLAREQGVESAKIEILGGLPATRANPIDDRARDFVFEALRDGNAQRAKALIKAIYSSGCGAKALADELIRPVMERIGHGWMVGSLDVFQEHEASQHVASSVRELIDDILARGDRPGPLALGAAVEGDPYVISLLLGELLLIEQGWKVQNLGVNLPIPSLANATRIYRPSLIFLSVNFLKDEDGFVREYHSFYKVAAAGGTAVILGGQALTPALRSRLVYASFGDRMAHLEDFASHFIVRGMPPSQAAKEPDERPG